MAIVCVTVVFWTAGHYGAFELIRWDDGGPSLMTPPGFRGPDGLRFSIRWLHPIVLLWAFLVMRCGPRSREAWVAAGLALIARLILSPDTILMGADYAYIRLADATGLQYVGKLYGPTWTSLMGAAWFISGGWTGHVQAANVVLSAGTVWLATDVARAAVGRRAGLWAAAVLSLGPLSIALARTESEFVLVGFLQVAALHGALSMRRAAAWAAALSCVLLAQARPDQIPVALALGVLLGIVGRRPVPAMFVLVGVIERCWDLGSHFSLHSLSSPAGLVGNSVAFRPETWLGRGGTLSVFDPTITPLLLAPLVLVGLLRGSRDLTWKLVVLWSLTTLPYLHFERPTDVLRFGLPGQIWWGVLAAIGLAKLDRGTALVGAAAAAASGAFAAHPLGAPFAWQVEHHVIEAALDRPRSGSTIFYRAPWDRTGSFRSWLDIRGAESWRELPDHEEPAAGDWYLSGRADARVSGGTSAPTNCSSVAIARDSTIRTDDVEPRTASPLRVTLSGCSDPER